MANKLMGSGSVPLESGEGSSGRLPEPPGFCSLGLQLHIGTCVALIEKIPPVKNRQVKPEGGFWTSTLKDGSSGWVDWCRAEQFRNPDMDNWFLLEPAPNARILTIDTLADLKRLLARYNFNPFSRITDLVFRYPDFERIAQRYDAMRLTEEGQWRTRMSMPDSLYGWDCESTLWFRWKFTSVRRLRDPLEAPVVEPPRVPESR